MYEAGVMYVAGAILLPHPPCDTSIIYVAGAMLVVGSVAGQLIAHDTHAPNLQAELFYEQVMQKMLHVVELKPQSETNDP